MAAEPKLQFGDEFSDEWGDAEEEQDSLAAEDVHRAVVTDTDWTAETILSQLRRGNIQLNPRFQRRDAWDKTRKSRFIESLILGLPIPQVVLAEDRNRRGAFIVLDGKQRLLTLRQFAAGSSVGDPSGDGDFETLKLRSMEVKEELNGLNLAALEENSDHVDDLNAFLNQAVRTVVVRSWPSEEFLHLVFLRLNTGSVKLSPQELRQALHPGPFTDFIDDHSADSVEIQRALRRSKPDFRMRDVELLLRFFALQYFLADYRGNLKAFLDDAAGRLNKSWTSEEGAIRSVADRCDAAIAGAFATFGKNAFYRWAGEEYERRFNRAVFEVITYYFADPVVVSIAERRAAAVEQAFKHLCDTNPDFVRAIQTTTKTISALALRLSAWGDALSETLSVPLPVPRLDAAENRIALPA